MSTLHFDCHHRYGSGFELKLAFEANSGITALLGPSGSGKTTTLNLIAGLLRPTTGQIHIGGHMLLDTQKNVFIPPDKRRIGYVFQDYLLFPHMTVEGNLSYGQKRRPTKNTTFEHVVEILELGDLLTRSPQSLSGGQQQRTALARALLSGPELLLMDEPLNAQHAELKERIATYLQRIVAEYQIPTIFVSHDEGQVRAIQCPTVRIAAGEPAR